MGTETHELRHRHRHRHRHVDTETDTDTGTDTQTTDTDTDADNRHVDIQEAESTGSHRLTQNQKKSEPTIERTNAPIHQQTHGHSYSAGVDARTDRVDDKISPTAIVVDLVCEGSGRGPVGRGPVGRGPVLQANGLDTLNR